MESAGYRGVDSMAVMALEQAKFREAHEVKVTSAGGADLTKWSEVYLRSFYGGLGLMKAMAQIVDSLQKMDEVVLVTGKLGGKTAGTMALYRTRDLLGAYCVGTSSRIQGERCRHELARSRTPDCDIRRQTTCPSVHPV